MKSLTTRRFRDTFRELPPEVQTQARKAYRLFQRDPTHPGLNFKKVDDVRNIYSARVGINYRAVGRLDGPAIIWFWIGSHGDYDKLI